MSSASTYSEAESTVAARAADAPPSAEEMANDLLRHLPQHDLPSPADTWLLHGAVPSADEPVIVLHQSAVQQINAHAQSNVGTELGGALLGQAYRYREGTIIEVKAALPAVSGDHGPVHFTFAADSWSKLQQDRAAHYPNLDIIGWFHTHPDLGVFYSADDVVVHSAAFTLPWHVGLVVDPIRHEASFFGWRNGQIEPISGFYELPDQQPESMTGWRAVQSAVWDHPYDAPAAAMPSAYAQSEVYLQPQSTGMAFSGRELSLLLSTLALVATFFLVVGGIMPLSERVDVLETTVLTLADQTLADSNAATCPDPRLRIITPINNQILPLGSTMPLVGTSLVEDAARYQVEMRPAGDQNWSLVDRFTRDTRLGELISWDTTGMTPGPYELRLTAVDRNNIRLSNSSACFVGVTLAP